MNINTTNPTSLYQEVSCLREQMQSLFNLQESNLRFATAFNNSPIPMAIAAYPGSRIIDINTSFCDFSGYSRQEAIGHTDIELKFWDYCMEKRDALAEIVKKYNVVRNVEVQIRRKDGEIRIPLLSAECITLSHMTYLLVWCVDITDLKKTEQALRTSEERKQRILNVFPDLLFQISDTGEILNYETAKDTLLYTRPENFLGKTILDILPADPARKIMHHIDLALATRETQLFEYQLSIRDILHTFEARIVWVSNKEILLIVRNITEIKQLRNKLARFDMLSTVGEMAASLAHELRNPMTTVRGFLQLLSSKPESSKFQSHFQLMIDELDRANIIISEYLSLAKNKAVQLQPQSFASIINSLAPLIQADANMANQNCEFVLTDTPDLLVDAKEIRQLILNLARNGIEAMQPGGTLTIKLSHNEESVILSVQDEGPGIPPYVMEKLGTPFFTTKDNGTGLGLAICYSIAAHHNAIINIDSIPERTIFSVHFNLKSKASMNSL